MARSIRSYPREERKAVIKRRLESNTKGLGYWGAYDAEYHVRIAEIRKKVVKNSEEKEE